MNVTTYIYCEKPRNTMNESYTLHQNLFPRSTSVPKYLHLPQQPTLKHYHKKSIFQQLEIIYPNQSIMSLATLDVRMPAIDPQPR